MSVTAAFDTGERLEHAVDQLREAGFRRTDLDVWQADIAPAAESNHTIHDMVKMTAAGIACGGIIGALCGLLAGMGEVSFAGTGPFVAAGPVMGLLSGAFTGGSIGAVFGAAMAAFFAEYRWHLEDRARTRSRALVSVQTVDTRRAALAELILKRAGGSDIAMRPDPEMPRHAVHSGRRR